MEAFGLAGLTALVWKVVDFLKFASNKDRNALITQASVWLSSLVISFLAREADTFQNFSVLGSTLGEMDWPSIVLFALGLGSTASGVYEFKKAVDNRDGSRTPSLLPQASNHDINAETEGYGTHGVRGEHAASTEPRVGP